MNKLSDERRTWHVYALSDPDTSEIRYIGWTVDTKKRLHNHVWESSRTHKTYKDRWIAKLVLAGKRPRLGILESGSGNWAAAERRWISIHREAGCRLTNATAGGEGVNGLKNSAESRARQAAKIIKKRPCSFCSGSFGAREMRVHTRSCAKRPRATARGSQGGWAWSAARHMAQHKRPTRGRARRPAEQAADPTRSGAARRAWVTRRAHGKAAHSLATRQKMSIAQARRRRNGGH